MDKYFKNTSDNNKMTQKKLLCRRQFGDRLHPKYP